MSNFRKRLCFAALLICAAALLFDWGHFAFKKPASARPAPPQYVMKQSEESFLLKGYDNAVKEIQTRLEQETLLFSFKFALVGSILALLFKNPTSQTPAGRVMTTANSACFVWAAVITSGVIDTRIHFHQDIIKTLGSWIHEQVEPVVLGNNLIGWESFLGRGDSVINSQFYPLLRLNTNLLTFILFASAAYVSLRFARPAQDGGGGGENTMRQYCRAGALGALFVFFFVGIHFHPSDLFWALSNLAILVIGCIAAIGLWK